MITWLRYAAELSLVTGGTALLLLDPEPVSRQILVSIFAALAMLAWLAELALIAALHMGRVSPRYAPTSAAAVVLLVVLTFAFTTLPHLALALGQSPETHYTALAQAEGRYSIWLRLFTMQVVLIGQGGYMRYVPRSFLAQIISGAVIKLTFLAKALVFSMVVRIVVAGSREARASGEAVRIHTAGGPLVAWRFVGYNAALFLVSLPLVLTMRSADANEPLAPRVLFVVVAVVANVVALVEIVLAFHRLFGRRHEHDRPSVPKIALQLVFYAHAFWAALMTTVLFDAARAWSFVLFDDPTPFKLWWRMWFVSAVAFGPGGTSLIIPRRVWIEVVFAWVNALWIVVLLLLLNVAASMTGITASEPRAPRKAKVDDNDDIIEMDATTLWSGQ